MRKFIFIILAAALLSCLYGQVKLAEQDSLEAINPADIIASQSVSGGVNSWRQLSWWRLYRTLNFDDELKLTNGSFPSLLTLAGKTLTLSSSVFNIDGYSSLNINGIFTGAPGSQFLLPPLSSINGFRHLGYSGTDGNAFLTFNYGTSLTDSVLSRRYLRNSLNGAVDLKPSSIVKNNLAANTVDSSKIEDGTVSGADIKDYTIPAAKLKTQLKNLLNLNDSPDYTGQTGIKNGILYTAISSTANIKWRTAPDVEYPYESPAGNTVYNNPVDSLENMIVDIYLTGSYNPAKRYSIFQVERNVSGRWDIIIYQNEPDLSSYSPVASFTTNINPEADDAVTVHKLSEVSSSGISGYIAVIWSKIPAGKSYSNMWNYEGTFGGYYISKKIWSGGLGYIKSVQTADSLKIYNSSISTKLDKPDKLNLTGYFIPDTQYVHPRGEAEYKGDNTYGYYGVGVWDSLPAPALFNTVLIKAAAKPDYPVRVRVYKSLSKWSAPYSLSSLTFLDSAYYNAGVLNPVDGKYMEVRFDSVYSIGKGEYVYILLGAPDIIGAVSIRRWNTYAGVSPERRDLLLSVNKDVFNNNWAAGGGAPYLCTPPKLVYNFNYRTKVLNDNLKSFIGTRADSSNPLSLLLPDTLYWSASDTTELNIYFDNLILVPDYKDYRFAVTCDSGKCYSRYYRWMPKATTTGIYKWIITIYNWCNEVVGKDSMYINVKPHQLAGQKRMLLFGDSNTDSNIYPAELYRLGGGSLTFIGTQDVETNSPNEGQGGWSYSDFANSGNSPFIYQGSLNFSNYLNVNNFNAPDYVYAMNGANEIISQYNRDDNILNAIDVWLGYADSIFKAIVAVNPAVKIGIATILPPAYEQDAFANNYNLNGTQYSNRWRYRRYAHYFNEKLFAKYGGGSFPNISVVPVYMGIDPENDMLTFSFPKSRRNQAAEVRQSNGLHPAACGLFKVADYIKGWLGR